MLKAHDDIRHLQILAAGVDLPLGGTGRPDAVGYKTRTRTKHTLFLHIVVVSLYDCELLGFYRIS